MDKVRITSEPGASWYLLVVSSVLVGIATGAAVYLTGRRQYVEAFNRTQAFHVEEVK